KGRMAPPKKKKKGKSGNPAKRAQQEREAAERAAQGPKAPSGAAFGAGKDTSDEVDPASLNLPAGFEKFLGRCITESNDQGSAALKEPRGQGSRRPGRPATACVR